ncbi:MAG: hypothetical protein K0S65_6801, partial [Labilithrix sp.]|nr:hypothetical protein [Labilithrix sp.]
YAEHIASGAGYRFDLHAPPSDGVTPLPWAPLLSLLVGGPGADLMVALERVKVLGIVAWTLAGGALGLGLARGAGGGRRGGLLAATALVVVAVAFPIGAWAASGMETGLATALATFAAVSFGRPRRAAMLAGLAATLRPELVVWAVVVAGGAALAAAPLDVKVARRFAATVALAAFPFVACAVIRLAIFGRAAPLALLAKPSDAQHGIVYAAAAAVVVLTPLLAFAPLALRRATALGKTLAVAGLVHVVVVVAVGGDWMPYARLMVPIAPSLALVFADTGRVAHLGASLGRAALALAFGGFVAVRAAPAGRQVFEARKELVARARPELASAHVVAALDVGWVGAATDARIVDLAGLTDPTIAVLSGGHTSKMVDVAMLLDREVDTVVVYGAPRIVEQRLLRSSLFEAKFAWARTIRFGAEDAQRYEIYRRR